jgi:hypothetical protein
VTLKTPIPDFAADYPEVAETIFDLRLPFYCANCYHKRETTYVTPNFGPFCDECLKELPPLPRCMTCKHWERLTQYSELHPAHASEPTTSWGSCELGSCGWGVVDHPETLMASAWGAVVSHEDFGCVQWEAK